jgi:hypothetical protein
MQAMVAATVTAFIVLFCWDIQFVPIRIVDRVEHKETFVFTVSMLKWPVLFKRKVYFVKSTQTWVIPEKQKLLEPTISYSDMQEAYLIWKYENDVD